VIVFGPEISPKLADNHSRNWLRSFWGCYYKARKL